MWGCFRGKISIRCTCIVFSPHLGEAPRASGRAVLVRVGLLPRKTSLLFLTCIVAPACAGSMPQRCSTIGSEAPMTTLESTMRKSETAIAATVGSNPARTKDQVTVGDNGAL